MTHDHTSDTSSHHTYTFTCLHSTHSISVYPLACRLEIPLSIIPSCCQSHKQYSAAVLRGHLRGHIKPLSLIEIVGKSLYRTSLQDTFASPAPSFGMNSGPPPHSCFLRLLCSCAFRLAVASH